MSTSRPFAYNTGTGITGTVQIGSLAIGYPTAGFESTGLEWWNGPDEEVGYVIAQPVPDDSQSTPLSPITASIEFYRSDNLSESEFVALSNFVAGLTGGGPFASGASAKTWLNNNGYWTSFVNQSIYLDSGDNSSYSGSGITWYDISGNNNNGTLMNGVSYSSAYSGILNFTPASSQYVSFSSPTNVPIGSSHYTINTWFNANSNSISGIVGWGTWGSYNQVNALRLGNNLLINYWWGNDMAIPYNYNTGQWYNLCVTFDGTHRTMYMNGTQVGQDTPGSPNVSTSANMQVGTTNGSEYFNGSIPIVMIYPRALTSGEVLSSYNAIYPRFVTTTTTTSTSTTTTTTLAPTTSTTTTTTITPTTSTTTTTTATPGIVTSGLVIQLDAYTNSSYPGTGSTVYDITSGYDHTLTGATYTVLNGVKCFDCTTGTNRVVVNGTGPTLPTTGYTYITWTRLKSDNSSFRTLLYTNSPKYTPITIPSGTSTLGYWDTAFRSSGYDVSSATDVWVQYAVVGDNSAQTFYINGSQVGSSIAYGSGGRTHWGWGNNDTASQPFGHVANMYLYNRQLSLSEIQQQYNFLAPRFIETTTTTTTTAPTTTTTTSTSTTTTTTIAPTTTTTTSTSTTTTTTIAPIVNTGLIMDWDIQNSSSYSGTGTTITDLKGNINGTMTGTIGYTSGSPKYLTIDGGVSEYIYTGNINPYLSPVNTGTAQTILLWVYPTSNGIIYSEQGTLTPDTSWFDVQIQRDSSGRFLFGVWPYVINGSAPITSSSVFALNNWYYVGWTYNGTTLTAYVNGVSVGSSTYARETPYNLGGNKPMYFNFGYPSSTDFSTTTGCTYRLGACQIYNLGLSGAQVLQNFNSNKSLYGL